MNDSAFDLRQLLEDYARPVPQRCLISPAPELAEKIRSEAERLNGLKRVGDTGATAKLVTPDHPGFNDGLIIPGSYFPLGTSVEAVRSAAADRAPLHGTLRVVVVLVDFPDKAMTQSRTHFEDLFFSSGVLPHGSVKEYYTEVTNGLVDLTGQVVGPFRMPHNLSYYANGHSGTGSAQPNARTMAADAAAAADASVNYGPYDNDANGYVDAFIVIHAGSGAEQTGSSGDIWSHKWVLPSEYASDGTKIYAYLTVPEDAKIGVCAHELGHLLFGFPDLYDTDNTSEGIGNWCLMASGSWGGGGDTPTHPSAWCKAQQAWVTVENVTTNGSRSFPDVKDNHTIYRLWKDGAGGQEYFLVENRQKNRGDTSIPAGGLLIWHIDDAIANNTNESHYKVALMQADGDRDLENNTNRGDAGDCWPGTKDNRSFTKTSNPNSMSYGSVDTCVSVTAISDPGPVMTANVTVKCGKGIVKDKKDMLKDGVKEIKEFRKEFKESLKERKEFFKEIEKPITDKAVAYDKAIDTKLTDGKRIESKLTDGKLADKAGEGKLADGKLADKAGEGGFGRTVVSPSLEDRLAVVEAMLAELMGGGAGDASYGGSGYASGVGLTRSGAAGGAPMGYASGVGQPFIRRELRPDLTDSALMDESDLYPDGPIDKRNFDVPTGW